MASSSSVLKQYVRTNSAGNAYVLPNFGAKLARNKWRSGKSLSLNQTHGTPSFHFAILFRTTPARHGIFSCLI